MKIFDPSLRALDEAPLQFELVDETDPYGDIRVLSTSGVQVAELLRLGDAHGQFELGEPGLAITLDGCWGLEVMDADGALLQTHIMCPTASFTSDHEQSIRELIVWATQTLQSALSPYRRNRG